MKTTNMILTTMLAMLVSTASVFAQDAAAKPVTNAKEALEIALKHEQIAPKADKMKLYSSQCTVSAARSSWSFTFTDGGKLLHSVSVSNKGKVYFNSRDRGSSKIFKDLDLTKLPAPKDVFVDGLLDKAKAGLKALKFEPIDGKYYMSYYLTNNYRQKDVAIHKWSVSMPVNDGSRGKTVGFENGKLESINNNSIKK